MTAKATQFGKPTFTSWLIEAAGTVPLKRRKDTPDGEVDNSEVLEKLKEVLEQGDAVCLFPEGFSRYHPTLAPLKTGGESYRIIFYTYLLLHCGHLVARIVSDVLTRQKDNVNYKINVLTCSITYM